MTAFFRILIQFIVSVVNVYLTPINTIVRDNFPDFSEYVGRFYELMYQYIGNGFAYFLHLLPPNTAQIIIVYLTLLVAMYMITVSIHVVIKVIEIIKNIKVW